MFARPQSSCRVLQWMLIVARFVLFVCAFQSFGAVQSVFQIVANADIECTSSCEDECEDHDCPPNCPICPCAQRATFTMPETHVFAIGKRAIRELDSGKTPYEGCMPPFPPTVTLYRPPRA